MFELTPGDFETVRSLFKPLMAYQLFCAGVIEGLYPGRVFVDDRANPRSGFVVKDGVWWYLAGDPHIETFNRALNAAIFDRTVGGEKAWGGLLTCHPAEWGAQMPAIFAPYEPIETVRRHYTCRALALDWQAQIPAGFAVRFVDQTLAADGLALPDDVDKVLRLRADADDPDHKAFGFVAVQDRQIAAYAVIDCIVNREGDIGLVTEPAFRRRGLAAVTSAAVIDYALHHGLEVVRWDCVEHNLGSIRTAEKLGLQLEREHHMYSLAFDPVWHTLNLAWSHLDAGRYATTLAVCARPVLCDSDKARSQVAYLNARAYAGLGQPEAAITALAQAARYGWDAVEETETDLTSLRDRPEWDGILRQIRENAQPPVEA